MGTAFLGLLQFRLGPFEVTIQPLQNPILMLAHGRGHISGGHRREQVNLALLEVDAVLNGGDGGLLGAVEDWG